MSEEPAAKKSKLAPVAIIDQHMEYLRRNKGKLRTILSDEFDENRPMKLALVYVGHIKNIQDISYAIQILNKKFPLETLQHLKRVRKRYIIMFPVELLGGLSIQDFINIHLPELSNLFEYFREKEVPALAPKIKTQVVAASRIWSLNFHPDKYLENLVSGNVFSWEDLCKHRKFMDIAFEACKWYVTCKNLNIDSDNIFKELNAAVVVDPSKSFVVAIAIDNRKVHPIQHAAMLAVDNVAKTQYGGAWNDAEFSAEQPGVDKDLYNYVIKSEKGGIFDPSLVLRNKVSEAYLCTGYYIYLIREPCLMCAMAMVHARVKRIFYCLDNPVGAVKSKVKLHTVSSLNHRFEVFTGFL